MTFNQPLYTAFEGELISICLRLEGITSNEVQVLLSLAFINTEASLNDYSIPGMSVLFSPGSLLECIEVLPNVDDLFERDETFFVEINSANDSITTSNNRSQVVIIDLSNITLGFNSTSQSVTEGEAFSVCIVILNGIIEGPRLPLFLTPSSEQGEGSEVYSVFIDFLVLKMLVLKMRIFLQWK